MRACSPYPKDQERDTLSWHTNRSDNKWTCQAEKLQPTPTSPATDRQEATFHLWGFRVDWVRINNSHYCCRSQTSFPVSGKTTKELSLPLQLVVKRHLSFLRGFSFRKTYTTKLQQWEEGSCTLDTSGINRSQTED
jgi:hypothetical protein